MPQVDLHIHTAASDGRLTPADVVARSAAAGLAVIAITDHDTVDGIAPALEAARAFPSLRVIPGVEISTDVPAGETHVLGYFVDHTDRALQVALEKMRNSRWERARKMVGKLADIDRYIEWERVQEIAGSGAVGRPHIALALIEKGHVESLQEAFARYIGHDGPAYVERNKMTPLQAVALIVQANGLPVLAHPLTVPDPEAMVAGLRAAGMIGIEAYYPEHSPEDISRLLSLADRYDLIATGGTDYHGLDASTQTGIGSVHVPMESVERLLALAEQRDLKPARP